MEPVKIFSGDEKEAGVVQHVLNTHLIGTWVKTPELDKENEKPNVEIFIEAEHETRARMFLASELPEPQSNTVF